jgi:hypothetical protein
MIPCAALVGTAFLERDVFASDAHVKVQFIDAGIRGKKFYRTYLKERDPTIAFLDTTGRDGFNSDCSRNLAMLRASEDFLWRTALENPARAHEQHLIAERQRIDPIVRHHNGRDSEISEKLRKFSSHMVARRGIERGERLIQKKKPRLTRESASQRDPLLLAA